jgi:hypothetical protein
MLCSVRTRVPSYATWQQGEHVVAIGNKERKGLPLKSETGTTSGWREWKRRKTTVLLGRERAKGSFLVALCPGQTTLHFGWLRIIMYISSLQWQKSRFPCSNGNQRLDIHKSDR